MKKLVILSDTHRNIKAIMKIAEIMDESDYVIHIGDHYGDMDIFEPMLKEKLYRVHGNCDSGNLKEIILEIEGRKLFITHGDLYGAKHGCAKLLEKAKQEGCDTVLYGHTHKAETEERSGVLFINPGNMTSYGATRSFCYAVINGNKITTVINHID